MHKRKATADEKALIDICAAGMVKAFVGGLLVGAVLGTVAMIALRAAGGF